MSDAWEVPLMAPYATDFERMSLRLTFPGQVLKERNAIVSLSNFCLFSLCVCVCMMAHAVSMCLCGAHIPWYTYQ